MRRAGGRLGEDCGDFFGLRQHWNVARGQRESRRPHPLCSEAFLIRVDHAVVLRHHIPGRLMAPVGLITEFEQAEAIVSRLGMPI